MRGQYTALREHHGRTCTRSIVSIQCTNSACSAFHVRQIAVARQFGGNVGIGAHLGAAIYGSAPINTLSAAVGSCLAATRPTMASTSARTDLELALTVSAHQINQR